MARKMRKRETTVIVPSVLPFYKTSELENLDMNASRMQEMTFSGHTIVGSFDAAALSLAAKHSLLFTAEKENDGEKDERRKNIANRGYNMCRNLMVKNIDVFGFPGREIAKGQSEAF